MDFCTDQQYEEFLRSCPSFEKMLIRSGVILIKYWFSVSEEEQEKRFRDRIGDPTKRWKISPMDVEARTHWVDYSKAKDAMFAYTDIKQSPWYVVDADIKKHARINCISHCLSLIPYKEIKQERIKLPEPQENKDYVRPPLNEQTFVPDVAFKLID
jgi:polyphosphate kinase 2 (PPK2 family)